jgi:hypothetical protein
VDALLAFIGEHRFVVAAQAGALLGTSEEVARTRLRELTDASYLIEEPVLGGQPAAYRITRLGLDVIGSRLRALRISPANYSHDVGAAWLWLAARNGAFGPVREVVAERVMRSRDAREATRRSESALAGQAATAANVCTIPTCCSSPAMGGAWRSSSRSRARARRPGSGSSRATPPTSGSPESCISPTRRRSRTRCARR